MTEPSTPLLVGAAVIIYVFAKTQIPIANAGKSAHDQVQPIAGYSKDGTPAMVITVPAGEAAFGGR